MNKPNQTYAKLAAQHGFGRSFPFLCRNLVTFSYVFLFCVFYNLLLLSCCSSLPFCCSCVWLWVPFVGARLFKQRCDVRFAVLPCEIVWAKFPVLNLYKLLLGGFELLQCVALLNCCGWLWGDLGGDSLVHARLWCRSLESYS